MRYKSFSWFWAWKRYNISMVKPPSFTSHISPAEFKSMAWKNGKGVTQEIAVFPPTGSLEKLDFKWRLSSAAISESGAFSEFPGYDRFLTVVSGPTLSLTRGGKTMKIGVGEIAQFSGDEKITSSCEKPLTDLGLVFKRDEIDASMALLNFKKEPRSFEIDADTTFFFVLSGSFKAEVFPGEILFSLEKNHVLKLDGGLAEKPLALFEPLEQNSSLIAIEIDIIHKY